jgi:translocation and assembly module TamB
VAPGVYVGARQSASGQAPQVNVQINLFRGLKLNSTLSNGTGANASGGENVGLSYQFDY